jgi:uncharacterized protein YdcH (DUF465 family)
MNPFLKEEGNDMNLPLGEIELKEHLLHQDEEYRRLAAQHQSYSEQLDALSSRHILSDDEKLEEITLKKKKLMLKDQMYSILQRYRKEMKAGH